MDRKQLGDYLQRVSLDYFRLCPVGIESHRERLFGYKLLRHWARGQYKLLLSSERIEFGGRVRRFEAGFGNDVGVGSKLRGPYLHQFAGGGAAGNWIADADYNGGTVAPLATAAVDTSLIPPPVPPQSVYQTERYGNMTYTLGGLVSGRTYTVQLHFAETYWHATGQREFNVLITGVQKLTNFDIIAAAGAANKAVEENFSATANASGAIAIQFTTGAADLPKISGIAVF